MEIRRWHVVAIALLAVGLVLTWNAVGQAGMKVGFSVSTQVNPFYKAMADGVRDQATAEGYEVTILNADDKLEKQIADVEDLIQKKIDVLIINATQDGAAAVLNKAADAGIPVITLQRAVPGAKVVSHIGTDNVVIGREGAMLKRVGRDARIALEQFLGCQVYLDLWVKVRKNWRSDERSLRELGYAPLDEADSR